MLAVCIILLLLALTTAFRVPCSKTSTSRSRALTTTTTFAFKEAKQQPNQQRVPVLSTTSPVPVNTVFEENNALFALLAALQLIPPLAILELPEPLEAVRRPLQYLYFVLTATTLVNLGGKQSDLKLNAKSRPISQKNAVSAPFVSSAFIFFLYCLIKFTPFKLLLNNAYQLLGTFLGVFSVDTTISSALNLTSTSSTSTSTSTSSSNSSSSSSISGEDFDEDPFPTSSLGLSIGTIVALSYFASTYLGGDHIEHFYVQALCNNLLTVSIALATLATIKLESFSVAAALLSGLFAYDIFWVFGSDTMMTVAKGIEAPVKFLFPAPTNVILTRDYPFSILGLGDVVVPGVLATLARNIDQNYVVSSQKAATATTTITKTSTEKTKTKSKSFAADSSRGRNRDSDLGDRDRARDYRASYLQYFTSSYCFGLCVCFVANEATKSGQPALLYLVPSTLLAMVFVAFKNGEMKELWDGSILPQQQQQQALVVVEQEVELAEGKGKGKGRKSTKQQGQQSLQQQQQPKQKQPWRWW